jgi:hypothetical protein
MSFINFVTPGDEYIEQSATSHAHFRVHVRTCTSTVLDHVPEQPECDKVNG